MGSVYDLLASGQDQYQQGLMRSTAGDRMQLDQRLGGEERMLNLGVNMAQAKAKAAYDQEVWQLGKEAADKNYEARMAEDPEHDLLGRDGHPAARWPVHGDHNAEECLMAEMEEFLAYIDSLPPSVQQSMMQYLMAGGDPNTGGTAPYGAGPMNTGRLGGQFQGPLGVSPYDPMSVGAAYAYTPQLDARGREQPFDLGTAQQNLNYVQDTQGNLFNNAMMMQGGEGVYAPGTFDALPQAPGEYDMLVQSAMSYGPTTYQGFIADRVAKGDTPDVALSNFWAVVNSGQPASAALLASLPPKYVQQENPMDPTAAPRMVQVEGGVDMQKPQEFVQQLTEAQMKQVPQAPQYGAVAQDFLDKGVPFPNERYGEGSYSMESQFPTTWGAGGHSAITEAQKRVEETRAAAQPQAIQQAQAKYLTGVQEESARPAAQSDSRSNVSKAISWLGDAANVGGNASRSAMNAVGSAAAAVSPGALAGDVVNQFRGPESQVDWAPEPPRFGAGNETAGITAQPVPPPPAPGMEPTTTGRSGNRVAATMGRSAENAYADAQKQLKATQEQVWSKPARDAYARNLAMNQLGRTPTQDTLMARQLVNYMMGAYGPRG